MNATPVGEDALKSVVDEPSKVNNGVGYGLADTLFEDGIVTCVEVCVGDSDGVLGSVTDAVTAPDGVAVSVGDWLRVDNWVGEGVTDAVTAPDGVAVSVGDWLRVGNWVGEGVTVTLGDIDSVWVSDGVPDGVVAWVDVPDAGPSGHGTRDMPRYASEALEVEIGYTVQLPATR